MACINYSSPEGADFVVIKTLTTSSTDIEKTNTLMNTLPTDTDGNRMMTEVHDYTPLQFAG